MNKLKRIRWIDKIIKKKTYLDKQVEEVQVLFVGILIKIKIFEPLFNVKRDAPYAFKTQ